ncbi:hypothetical protein EMIT0357P_10037 [Pseudomonas marginalis]
MRQVAMSQMRGGPAIRRGLP